VKEDCDVWTKKIVRGMAYAAVFFFLVIYGKSGEVEGNDALMHVWSVEMDINQFRLDQ
jgi:hypothetical protein